MRTEALHGDVMAGLSTYNEPDHELVDAELSGYRQVDVSGLPAVDDGVWGWTADSEEFADDHVERLHTVIDRPDADVQADVQRILLLDGLVPTTVGAQVCDGVVTLTGSVGADREREGAKYLVGLVPGVYGVMDEIACWPLPAAADADGGSTEVAVAAALRRVAIHDVAELTIAVPRPGTVVLSGAVRCRSDHDVAVAAAWSVAEVQAVDDCIHVEC